MSHTRFEPFSSVDVPDDDWAASVGQWNAARDRFDPIATDRPQPGLNLGQAPTDVANALRLAEMPHQSWQVARAQQLAMRDSSAAAPVAASAQTAPPARPQIDPDQTAVFQKGPDGKLHPIPGWHTTGPFDFGTWSKNIDWRGVSKDLGHIAAGVTSWFLPPVLGPLEKAAVLGNFYTLGEGTLDDLHKGDKDSAAK